MTEFSPSLLAADFSNLREEVKKVAKADYLHLDIMDGRFVPNITFGPGLIKSLRQHTELPFDTHLMIVEPEKYVNDFADAGSDLITFHAEAAVHLDRVVNQIKEAGCQAGIALNPATPLNLVEYLLPELHHVLLMTVNPGFGGQKFIPYMLEKIEQMKSIIDSRGLKVKIQIDGGVYQGNLQEVVKAGTDIIVAGSAVFKQENPAVILDEMRESLNSVMNMKR